MDVCDILKNEVITLYNRIKSKGNSEFDFLLSEKEIDDIVLGRKTDFEERVQKLVRAVTATFAEDILGALRERGLVLRTGCVVFVGGGAMLLKAYLERSDKGKEAIFIEEIHANALCYAKLYNLSRAGR